MLGNDPLVWLVQYCRKLRSLISLSYEDVSILGMVGIVGLCAWQLGTGVWGQWWLTYWQYAPNRYRLWEQITLWIAQGSASFVLDFTVLSWVVFVSLSYLVIRPIRHSWLLFLWLGWFAYWGYITNAPVYFLLALVGHWEKRKRAAYLLVPLILLKEAAFIIAGLFLFVRSRRTRVYVILCGSAAIGLYCLMQVVLGEVPYFPNTAPFFTPFYLLETVRGWSAFTFIVLILCTGVLVLFSIKVLGYWWLWLIVGAMNCLFGIPWEPQLWFPIVLLLESSARARSVWDWVI
jgi:hypothetical protein